MTYKHVAVSQKTYERLAKEGKWGESMDDIVSRILDAAKNSTQLREAITCSH